MSSNEQVKFGKELIVFYKEFLLGSSKAVEQLAQIQKEYPEQYKIIREMKDDPEMIEQITMNLSEDVKDTLLLVIVKASTIGKRMNNLFELNSDEQKKLSEDIKKFSEYVEKRISDLYDK
jgi:hypothetical protein